MQRKYIDDNNHGLEASNHAGYSAESRDLSVDVLGRLRAKGCPVGGPGEGKIRKGGCPDPMAPMTKTLGNCQTAVKKIFTNLIGRVQKFFHQVLRAVRRIMSQKNSR